MSIRKMYLTKCQMQKSSLTIKIDLTKTSFFYLPDEELKEILSTICTGRCPRNMEYDNDTIRKTINEIMDQVLY